MPPSVPSAGELRYAYERALSRFTIDCNPALRSRLPGPSDGRSPPGGVFRPELSNGQSRRKAGFLDRDPGCLNWADSCHSTERWPPVTTIVNRPP